MVECIGINQQGWESHHETIDGSNRKIGIEIIDLPIPSCRLNYLVFNLLMYGSKSKNILHRLNLNMHKSYSFVDNLDSLMVSNIRFGDKFKIFGDKFMMPIPPPKYPF